MNNEKYIVCSNYTKSDTVINEIKKMIKYMWKNDNELIINSIFSDTDKKELKKYIKVSKAQLLHQRKNLKEGVRLGNKSIDELREILKNSHRSKTRNAFEWLKKNKLY